MHLSSTEPSAAVPAFFHPAIREWFEGTFRSPTTVQILGWEAIASGDSTLILAPTGSGKTLAAFLWCIHRLMFTPPRNAESGSRVVYISPLKALAVDVERNLRAPLAGIAQLASHDRFSIPTVSIRTGDTPPRDRARFLRRPSEILITTPESLYLLLTSRARESLRNIETVIIDEIHALVPTKRGSHLALSLERLAVLNSTPFQRIGLSATQRPLDEVARFLGGAIHRSSDPCGGVSRDGDVFLSTAGEEIEYRPVTIIDTRERKKIAIRVEMPAQAPLTEPSREDANQERPRAMSIWPAMHPRLLDLIRQHRSTLIFVNSRRLAERLAAALNDLAGEVVARAHHGSLAREQRLEIEERLKAGLLPALVATSSLELGIDMGAIDLVIQIEAPPSVASGLQRIGRASHHIGGVSEGVIVPRHRGDLLACAAVSEAIAEGRIEAVHYPRNPLDVLAQQIVAMVSVDAWDVNELLERIRCSAPFAELPRSLFEGVLDLLSGVYPSEEFTELRPRIVWNRASGRVTARPGAQRLAIANAGTIPDRGLYGVFLAGAEGRAARVGELDEEMVFEARVGEVFALGASTWRIEEITHDRLLVTAAPGEQAKMPFWRGETAQRPFELGQEIGVLLRELQSTEPASAEARLERKAHLDPNAAASLLQYLRDQQHSGAAIPDDRTVIVERCPDELGDWRVFILSPFGGRVHAPWAMVTAARIREELATVVEVMWEDDGFMVRLPQSDEPPDPALFVPDPDQIHPLLMRQLGASAFFAARFRENAARALLLPRRRPGSRTPLWLQRKRASDLLQAASKFSTFPILLETFRECLLDSFDVPALQNLSRRMRSGEVEVRTVDTDRPSPFATSLLFRHVASSIYEGDAPLAERRARALAIDQTQLRELIGEIELR
ncbi:MAG TPA: DEAD/DEAH box helicase, partial [Thermoanaerobaculia bacterium]|nr:DEAD/DEAH box helicase [Thermoanaerobaculia bacterium]